MSASFHRDQRKVFGPLVLELWVIVSCPKWMLRLKLRFSGRAANTLNL